jgi:hypothetical protein
MDGLGHMIFGGVWIWSKCAVGENVVKSGAKQSTLNGHWKNVGEE